MNIQVHPLAVGHWHRGYNTHNGSPTVRSNPAKAPEHVSALVSSPTDMAVAPHAASPATLCTQ